MFCDRGEVMVPGCKAATIVILSVEFPLEEANETVPLVTLFHITSMLITGVPLLQVLVVPEITPPVKHQFIYVLVLQLPEIVY